MTEVVRWRVQIDLSGSQERLVIAEAESPDALGEVVKILCKTDSERYRFIIIERVLLCR